MCSLYEFIHSFRKSPEEGFPEISSDETKEALTTMKKIMNKVSSGI